ncbi:hypothetical protein ACFXD5_06135 [Streptomyces sp. NPDC059385]
MNATADQTTAPAAEILAAVRAGRVNALPGLLGPWTGSSAASCSPS